MKRHYFVKLRLILGSYEKTGKHLVLAESEKEAGTLAILNECHDKPEWSGDGVHWTEEDKQECWDCGEFVYQVQSVKKLTFGQHAILKKLM